MYQKIKSEKEVYTHVPETFISYVSKTETSGFIPRSIEIQRMYTQGELNNIMRDYQESVIKGNPNEDLIVGLANIKNLDKVELESAIKERISHYKRKVEELNNKYSKYYDNINKPSINNNIEDKE